MKDAALVQMGSAAWQTPHHGDFAQYVEELTGGQAELTLDEPGRVVRLSERAARASMVPLKSARGANLKYTAASPSVETPAELAVVGGSVGSVLGAVRGGLLLIALIQLGLLLVLSVGSIAGIGASLLAWWLVGRVKRLFSSQSLDPGSRDAALAKIRRELLARTKNQRDSGRS